MFRAGKFCNGDYRNSKKSKESPYFETTFFLLLDVFFYVYAAVGAINVIRLTESAFWAKHQSTRG
jgi:hypothetical protein